MRGHFAGDPMHVLPVQIEEQKPRVLVIDDSMDVHRLLAVRLKNEDLTLEAAVSGEEGISAAARIQPALVLLDLDMPGMHGFEVLRRLKDMPETRQVPVIVLSGNQSSDDKVAAFDLGAVDYISKPFEFTELRVRVRSALRMRQLLLMLSQRAQIDGLTGLWNRAYFDSRWDEEYARCMRHGHPLSVAVCDLDHFKAVNDTYGHPAGDEVLQGVARILRRECRQSDMACRLGGEEFVLVMPETDCMEARAVGERIRRAVELAVWPRHPMHKVTISLGIAGSSGTTTISPTEWVEVADQNLYAAKHAGRNCVVATDVTRGLSKAAG